MLSPPTLFGVQTLTVNHQPKVLPPLSVRGVSSVCFFILVAEGRGTFPHRKGWRTGRLILRIWVGRGTCCCTGNTPRQLLSLLLPPNRPPLFPGLSATGKKEKRVRGGNRLLDRTSRPGGLVLFLFFFFFFFFCLFALQNSLTSP